MGAKLLWSLNLCHGERCKTLGQIAVAICWRCPEMSADAAIRTFTSPQGVAPTREPPPRGRAGASRDMRPRLERLRRH